MNKIICLDPGHGGYDSGIIENGLIEKDMALITAKSCSDVLKYHGIDVIMTRDSDIHIDGIKRRETILNSNAEIFISFHYDKHDNMKEYSNKLYSNNTQLSSMINDENSIIIPFTRFDKLYLNIFDSSMPTLVVEGRMVDNNIDMNQVNVIPDLQLIGKQIAIKLLNYLNITVKPDVIKAFSNTILYSSADYGLNIRGSLDVNSPIIDIMEYSDYCTLLEIFGLWSKIQFKDKIGYVFSDYLLDYKPTIIREAKNILKIGLTFRDKNGAKTGTILYGEKVKVYEKLGDMYRVNYNGITGYVKSQYLRF